MTDDDSKKIVPSKRQGLIDFDDMDRWFDNFLTRRWHDPFTFKFPLSADWSEMTRNVPQVDIIDHDHEVEIRAALPGVKKEDLDVSISDQRITIKTSSKQEKKEEKENYYRREISSGEFQRTLTLPADVDADKADAKFEDGILNVTIPKLEQSKRKSIEVK